MTSSVQTSDDMKHLFEVMVESSTDAPKATGLVLMTSRKHLGISEAYWYRATSDGKLEKAVLVSFKINEEGPATATQEDINSPEIKDRFQHELDLWLKKIYLKKEWRSTEFSGGALKKSGAKKVP